MRKKPGFIKLPVIILQHDSLRNIDYNTVKFTSYLPHPVFDLSLFYEQFEENTSPTDREICAYFAEGKCKYSENCGMYHPEVVNAVCSLCKASIRTSLRKVGVLSGCKCVFCLPCIKQRRGRGNVEKRDRNSCPVCKVYSECLYGSKILPARGEDMDKLLRYLMSKKNSRF